MVNQGGNLASKWGFYQWGKPSFKGKDFREKRDLVSRKRETKSAPIYLKNRAKPLHFSPEKECQTPV